MKVEQKAHPAGEQGVRASLDAVAKRVAEGGINPVVRRWAIEMLDNARRAGRNVHTPRNRAVELLHAVQDKLWVPDPVGAEFIQSALLTSCKDPNKPCFKGGDCFAEGTLLLTDEFEVKPIEEVRAGEKIWGLGKWTDVEAVKYKGELPVTAIKLNNGGQLMLTKDHHVYVLECRRHPNGVGGGRSNCSCSVEERDEKRIRVSELRVGMVLTQPQRLPFGDNKSADAPDDPDRALIEGLYVSDGWADYQKNNRFFISGQDGCSKEQQKLEVQTVCERLDVPTSWHRKHITIRDKDWALRVQLMGRYAPEKHLLTINLDEALAAASLRGIMADSGKNTKGPGRTFTTTSHQLFVQTRILHKMFGVTCGSRFISDHGGFGKNPIWRLSTRHQGARQNWLLRVREISRDIAKRRCWDIQTSDHRVYLPEHDVTVSNCDDLVTLLGAAFLSVGVNTLVVGHGYGQGGIRHVLTAAHVDGKWHYADPSSYGPEGKHFQFGVCAPFTRERLYSVPNIKVLCDDQRCIRSDNSFKPETNDFVTQGVFVGVDGVPAPPFAFRFRWLIGEE